MLGSQDSGLGSIPTAAEVEEGPPGPPGPPGGVNTVNGRAGAVVMSTTKPGDTITTPSGTSIVLAGGGLAVAANAAALGALSAANFPVGNTLAFVSSFGDYFMLQISALAVDNTSVIAATGLAGAQWVRLLIPTPSWAAQAAWFIDPVSGSDEAVGSTSATAIQTVQELKRRWWGREIKQATTVTIVGNVPSTDVGEWNTTRKPNISVSFIGSLGATTGFGGRAIDNTLYSGTVTAFQAGVASSSTTDINFTDTAIPVSFTASGLMGNTVLCKRTNSTAWYWFLLLDKGGKTARITVPQPTGVTNTMAATLTVGDAWSAYGLWTFPTQNWGPMLLKDEPLGLLVDSLADNATTSALGIQAMTAAPFRRRQWLQATRTLFSELQLANCAIEVTGSATLYFVSGVPATWSGGGARGNSATNTITLFGPMGNNVPLVLQNVALGQNDYSYFTAENGIMFCDLTIPMVSQVSHATFQFNTHSFLSGVNCSGKIFFVDGRSEVNFTDSMASPVLVAGITSDASPFEIGPLPATNYPFASVPIVPGTSISDSLQFPYGPTSTANGTVATVLGSLGPAGASTTVQRWLKIPDGAGGFYTLPSWT